MISGNFINAEKKERSVRPDAPLRRPFSPGQEHSVNNLDPIGQFGKWLAMTKIQGPRSKLQGRSKNQDARHSKDNALPCPMPLPTLASN